MTRTEKQIVNCFKALNILSRGSTMKDLAVRLNISARSAYRYLEVLQNIGFIFEDNSDHVYKLIQSTQNKHLTISFTKQEMDFILDQLPTDGENYKSIRDKLYIHSDILTLPNKVQAAEFGRNIRLLDKAIQDKQRVILRGYSSAHSNHKEDYKIEPVQLDDNYQRLYAYDLEVRDMRQFKTERIELVERCDEDQWFTSGYLDKIKTDCFGWRLEEVTWKIELEMTRAAYLIFRDVHPVIEKDTREIAENTFLLSTTVASLLPVTSMILQMPGEIRVIKPRDLEEEAAKRIQKLDFFKKYFRPVS